MPDDVHAPAVPTRGRAAVRDFLSALGDRHSWSPRQNSWTVFGFLWGLPVPIVAVALHAWAAGRPFTETLASHPVHLLFALHPFLFAAIFGALGTLRRRQEREARRLMAELEHHVADLDRANASLRELDQLKAQFMANVTHELKTPLVAVRGYVGGILEGRFGPVADAQRSGLEIALRNAGRLQNLIEELLDFERLESKELPLKFQDFDLGPVVGGAIQALAPEIESKGLVVRTRIPAPVFVHADPEQIRRVVVNLLSNAVKFSEPAKPVGIEAAVSETEERVLVTVWDRGPGIPTAAQKFLFTRFWQADGTASRKHGGTGLGLAIVKGILDAHQASIRVVSSGEGTRVQFELPLAQPVPSKERGA